MEKNIYFDRKGNPITFEVYQVLIQNKHYSQVGYTTLPKNIVITTRWFGITNWLGMFESQVLIEGVCVETEHYDNEEDAIEGHQKLIRTYAPCII